MAVDVPRPVITKLIVFTAAMIFLPLITFFSLQQVVSSSVVSGILSAAMANLVLLAYIALAFSEEAPPIDEKSSKKTD